MNEISCLHWEALNMFRPTFEKQKWNKLFVLGQGETHLLQSNISRTKRAWEKESRPWVKFCSFFSLQSVICYLVLWMGLKATHSSCLYRCYMTSTCSVISGEQRGWRVMQAITRNANIVCKWVLNIKICTHNQFYIVYKTKYLITFRLLYSVFSFFLKHIFSARKTACVI